jgi:hypothetical protein
MAPLLSTQLGAAVPSAAVFREIKMFGNAGRQGYTARLVPKRSVRLSLVTRFTRVWIET